MRKRYIALLLIWIAPLCGNESIVFDPSQSDLSKWKNSSNAFHIAQAPIKYYKTPVGGAGAAVLTSFDGTEKGRGILISPPFTIENDYLNLRMGGHRLLPETLGAQLLIDGRVVNGASGRELRAGIPVSLYDTSWDLRPYKGKQAQLKFIDETPDGSLWVGKIWQSDHATTTLSNAGIRGRENFRPKFHFVADYGHLNDPNGLFSYTGLWHLMFQYRYAGSQATAWGHAISKDLLHWKQLEQLAICADASGQAFSGSGMVDWENKSGLQKGQHPPIILFYTQLPPGCSGEQPGSELARAPRAADTRYYPAIAYSTDGGMTFTKSTKPLFRSKDKYDRDPKAFWHSPSKHWIMVWNLSANNERDKTAYGIYRSKELMKGWELTQRIEGLWECPDLFPLPLDGDPGKIRWVMTRGSGEYFVGDFDGKEYKIDKDAMYPDRSIFPLIKAGKEMKNNADFLYRVHYAGEFYAAQTFSDGPQGRRVQIGWVNIGKQNQSLYPGMPFVQQMSIPMDLTLRTTPQGVRLFHWPVKEIETIRAEKIARENITISPDQPLEIKTSSDLLDARIIIDLKSIQKTTLTIELNGEEIVYFQKGKERFLQYNNKRFPVEFVEDTLDLRILLDNIQGEVFVNGGIKHIRKTFFKNEIPHRLKLSASGEAITVRQLEIYSLNP